MKNSKCATEEDGCYMSNMRNLEIIGNIYELDKLKKKLKI